MSSMPREALKTSASKPGVMGVANSRLNALARAITSCGSEMSAGVILSTTSIAMSRVRGFLRAAPLLRLVAQAQTPAASVTVDASANRHAINPNLYGVAYGTTPQLSDLNVPRNRYGGNNSSRYNWQINGDNRGQDWYFESIGDSSSVAGERGDTFIANSRAGGAQAMITVPIIAWIAKLGTRRAKLASFSQAKDG